MTEKKVKLQVPKTDNDTDNNKVVGHRLFPELYANIYISAKKKSGKTTLLFNILKKCATRSTKVLIFCPTVNKDPTYKEITKMLDSKGIDHNESENFIDEEGNDLIELFIKNANAAAEQEEPEVLPTSRKYVSREEARVIFGDELPKSEIEKKMKEDMKKDEEKRKKQMERKKRGKGKISPEYILVFDDLGQDLRKKSISQLLIKNRHYKCKVIISSQWLNYLMPTAIRQLDYCLLFGGFPTENMEDLYRKLNISVDFNKFIEMYKEATEKKYHFLYIDVNRNEYKKDFNEKFNV